MCGIAGYFSVSNHKNQANELIDMIRAIRRRGPDDEGFTLINTHMNNFQNLSGSESNKWVQTHMDTIENKGKVIIHNLAFAHRRFSIIDLTPAGHQPMWSNDGNICVSFNGEIYNYIELRSELEKRGHNFYTSSDTEVLLEAYIEWGTDCFARFNGPMAISLYDKPRKALFLSRDRIGKAPLYYTVRNNCFYWASEIKAFLNLNIAAPYTLRNRAIDDYMYFGFRDIDGTFWNEIKDFPPASYALVNQNLSLEIKTYWQMPSSRLSAGDISRDEAVSHLSELLLDTINLRLRADVPVAFELSGGLDSSSLVSLTAAKLSKKINTYTIKFSEKHSDEEPFARKVSRLYSDTINYHVIKPVNIDFWENADDFFWVEEEPFHSPNLHTNQALRNMIRQEGIKVVIAGSGGDEVLAGYPGEYFQPFLRYLLSKGRAYDFFHEIMSCTEFTPCKALLNFGIGIIEKFIDRSKIVKLKRQKILKGIYIPSNVLPTEKTRNKKKGFSGRMIDNMTNWQMNYWLRSGNKASFAIPIEPRAPFLDFRVVEFAFSLPPEYLIHDGWHKWILRKAIQDILPKNVVWRKQKMGFPFPHKEWLSSSKNNVAMNLLNIKCPYLDTKSLMNSYDRLNQIDPYLLWRLICLGLWWRKIIERKFIMTD